MANVGIIMIASKRIEEKKEAKSYILLITLYEETVRAAVSCRNKRQQKRVCLKQQTHPHSLCFTW